MAFTKDDLDNIKAAIASGELSVMVDGRQITYRSISDLIKAKQVIEAELSPRRSSAFAGFRVIVDRGIR